MNRHLFPAIEDLLPALRGGSGKEPRIPAHGGRSGRGRDLCARDRRLLRRLRAHDFELAHLALLTVRGIKPASRWEMPLPRSASSALRGLGLAVRPILRRTLNGFRLVETLFSMDRQLLDGYAARFDQRLIEKTPSAVRYEGRLFGYPPCCVERFVNAPYSANGLAAADQAVLFHWACPGCLDTKRLVRSYQSIQALLKRL